ncbi:MAG TPA: RNA polymerase sigma factor [Actinomycetota bacterium]|nr:RNA polymerase sigma factor [Actinomycetota bacterium]
MKGAPPFQRLLEEQGPVVHRYLRAVAGQEADDLFQETFLAALRAYPRLADARNLRGWVLRIATRKAIDAGRRRSRQAIPVEEVPEVPAPPSPDGEPALWAAVRSLPPKQRAAVVHRYVYDLTYEEIAGLMGGTAEAARANASQGVRRLREVWEG